MWFRLVWDIGFRLETDRNWFVARLIPPIASLAVAFFSLSGLDKWVSITTVVNISSSRYWAVFVFASQSLHNRICFQKNTAQYLLLIFTASQSLHKRLKLVEQQ